MGIKTGGITVIRLIIPFYFIKCPQVLANLDCSSRKLISLNLVQSTPVEVLEKDAKFLH